MLSILQTVCSYLEVLSNHERLISVIQYFVYTVGSGNVFSLNTKVSNFDIKAQQTLINLDLGMTADPIPLVAQPT
ncbi:MAG: hypothetical protein RMJ87_07030 [Cytophagales bacterium]|nr:hypothetical protein [Bernardetiaceae bacterium]MDW8204764.1 hypothetical protein [Cytophagales bacterium]